MAKKSNKRPPRLIKESTGCMRGLISLFDFRQEHVARKLLSDREHGRDMPTDNGHTNVQLEEFNKFTNKVDGRRSGKASVKRLMEEEMSWEHPQRKISSGDVQSIISDLGSVVESRKNHKQRSRKSEVISDAPADQLTSSVSFDNHESEIINLTEKSSHNFDPASLLVELCSYGNRCEETLDVSNNVINFYIALKTIFENMQNRLDDPEPLPDQRYPILRSALADAANTIASQNSVNEKQIMGQTYIQTKEIMDALQVLNSNRELIVKLFQDSDSILLKHIQDFQSSGTENLSDNCIENIHMLDEENGNSVICGVTDSNKPFHRQSKYKFLWKKDKTKETQPSKEGSSSNSSRRIVVLKPNPSRIQNHPILSIENSSPQSHHNLGYKEDEERIASYFSLNGIKRRLKRVFGERKKEQHVISMDGMLHRIPIRSKDSSVTGEQLHNDPAIMSSARKSSTGSENPSGTWQKDKRTIFNDGASSMPGHLIYLEAKKHIAELLGAGDRIHSLPKRRTSRSLGRLLSFPEYNVYVSPRCSLREQQEITLSSKEAECSLVEQILPEATINIKGPLSQNLEASFCSGDDLNDQVKKLDLNRGLTSNDVEDKSHIPEDLNIEGSLDTAEADNIISDLASSQSKPLSELSEESAIKSKRYEEALSVSSVLMLDSSEDKAENLNQADLSQDSQDMDSSLASEDTIKGQEKLSPVSVLQTMYSSEDITSPECTTTDDCNLQMQMFNAEDNDNPSEALMSLDSESIRACSDVSLARSQYIRSVLEASGLTSTALSDRWLLEDQLLDSSLFDEVEPSFFPPQDDEKFLFDCINEVLVEIQERFYKCSPSLSFIRSIIWPAPSGEKLIKEVTKGIEHHIRTHSPKPVDETIKTGVEKEEWMNFRLETENIVIDIWFTVLDDLLEETVFDLWF